VLSSIILENFGILSKFSAFLGQTAILAQKHGKSRQKFFISKPKVNCGNILPFNAL